MSQRAPLAPACKSGEHIFGSMARFGIKILASEAPTQTPIKFTYLVDGQEISAVGHLIDIDQSFTTIISRVDDIQNCALFDLERSSFLENFRLLIESPEELVNHDQIDFFNSYNLWFHQSMRDTLIFAIACGDQVRVFCERRIEGKVWETCLKFSEFRRTIETAEKHLSALRSAI